FDQPSCKGLDLRPVGEVGDRARVGGAAGDPHDQADHVAVEETVARVFDLAPEHLDLLRLPADLAEELAQVGVGVGLALVRLAADRIDREEGVRARLERRLVAVDEILDRRAMVTVADAGADHHAVAGLELGGGNHTDLGQLDFVSALTRDRCDPLADLERVAVDGGIDDQQTHGLSWMDVSRARGALERPPAICSSPTRKADPAKPSRRLRRPAQFPVTIPSTTFLPSEYSATWPSSSSTVMQPVLPLS